MPQLALYATMCTIYNMIVKDAMVLIHLAKLTLLEKSCDFFKDVIIPELVYREAVTEGKGRAYTDAFVIEDATRKGKIKVKKVKKPETLKELRGINIQGGEAEAIALYWEEKADLIASDDSNVLGKRDMLNINLIGTPSIILTLYKKKFIDKEKIKSSVKRLREIGWFSNSVLDKIIMEAD